MEIPLLEGRLFTERDDEGSPLVAIVSTRVAREFFPDGHAIGKRISLANSGRWWEIVGVVGDVKNFLLESPGTPNLYLSYLQAPEMSAQMSLVVRSSSDPSKLSALARQQIQAVDQDVPVASVCTMDEYLGGATAMRRFQTGLLGSFAGLAVLLAMVGIYSVVAYSVAQRTHELGVRMALGAQQADVLKLVLGQGMALTLLGVATGLAGAAALTRLLSGLLHGVRPGDPATFLGVPLVFGAVALAASYIPARRATRVDPITALRYE
jgi:putative ABC transport system permease protein